jgi:predicted PilT family ATPase
VAKVFVDGRNVQRSQWPNLSEEELVERTRVWAERHGHEVVLIFDGEAPEGAIGSGSESADDWLIREVPKHRGAWLVTSDRALRDAAATQAGRVIGGGGFLRELEK